MLRFRGFRRFAAALSGAFLLQLSLLGTGTLCAMEHGSPDPASPAAHASHAGMRMGDAGAGTAAHDAGAPPARCDVAGSDDACGLPWAPGHCAAMTTCSATVAPAAQVAVQLASATIAVELPEPALIHSGPSTAPELPPPRA